MAVLFFGGFESGGVEFSTPAGSPVADTSIKRGAGAYSLKIPDGSQCGQTFTSGGTRYARAFVYISAAPTAVIDIIEFAGGSTTQVQLQTDRTLRVESGSSSIFAVSSMALTAATWYMLQVRYTKGTGANAISELKIHSDDGTLLETVTITNGSGTADVGLINFDGSGSGIDIYVDDVIIDDAAYPGIGTCIKVQGKSSTPTDDAFAKNGAATSHLCWSDTPFDTATNCSSAASTAAQIMSLAASEISASDTINACKVALVGKRGTGGSVTVSARRRVSAGSPTDSVITLSTSDAFHSSAVFSETLSNIGNMEIGVVRGAGTSQLTTIEDVWLMVDYTVAPGAGQPRLLRDFGIPTSGRGRIGGGWN
jgi:hypothetical protein